MAYTIEEHNASRQRVNRREIEQFFAGVSSRMEPAEAPLAHGSSRAPLARRELVRFFSAISHRAELADANQCRMDRRLAAAFNVFDLIEPDENKLSDILAGLLDPNGAHGQGDLFLRLLLKHAGFGSHARLARNATVQREAPTHGILKFRRRMDVFVEAGVLLAIENKVDSLEQPDQVRDYLDHLHAYARRRRVRSTLIYLTPDGRPPTSLRPSELTKHLAGGSLHCWSYQRELRAWLEDCCRGCQAQRIRGFLSDLIAYVDRAMKRGSEMNQEVATDET